MEPSNQKTTTTSDVNEMQTKIDTLEAEKKKLEQELKMREEMMNNLLTYIQNSSKI
jgi:predicted nuclease with TOPRIM domain